MTHPGDMPTTDNERKLIEAAIRAGHAKTALGEFGAALDLLEREYTEAWKATRFDDDDGRQRLWQAVQIVGKVRSHLEKVAASGKLATTELAQIRQLGKKKPFFNVV